jgi:hypothetical protein
MSVPGLFTHGSPNHRLPHPPVPVRLLLAAHAAFVEAFAMLRAAPPAGFVLVSAGEKAITRQLKDILANNLLPGGIVPGFNRTFFSYVTRDAELTSYDGKHPDKKPDLLLGLQRPDAARVIADQDAVFVECKPADAAHPLTTEYGANGIRRFVHGEYAWAMTSAMMVAYVRGGLTIARELRANLKKNKTDPRFGKPTLGRIVPGSKDGAKHEALRTSRHHRGFKWPANGKPAPAIVLCHSWHDCS